MELKHNNIDTITLGGMVNIHRLGKLYYQTTSWNLRNKPTHTFQTDKGLTPQLLHKQDWGGNARIHTTSEFINQYGYGITIHIPKRVEYLLKTGGGKPITDKQQQMLDRCGYRVVVEIPSMNRLLASKEFLDYLPKYQGKDELSGLVWSYIQSMHNFNDMGIGGYDNVKYMKTGEEVDRNYLSLSRIDFAYDITGVSSIETLDLIKRYGYISWSKITQYHNDYKLDDDTSTLLNTPNGIEYRRGKNSSEIYKFYDKENANRNFLYQHYDPIYTSKATKQYMDLSRNKVDENLNRNLRYEVSIFNKTGANRRIDAVYERITGERKKINLYDVLDNKLYQELPKHTLRDGLNKIFGSAVSKPITETIGDEATMKDADILKEYGSKGLKFLGIKHLIDKNMSQDQVRTYLTGECGMNYETTRRLFADLREARIMDKWKDTHIQSMDALRKVYHGLV